VEQVVYPVLVFAIGGMIAWLAKAVFTLQRLMQYETQPNGGRSMKDYQRKVAESVEKNRTSTEGGISRIEQGMAIQNRLLEEVLQEMREHNRQTSELVNTLIRSR